MHCVYIGSVDVCRNRRVDDEGVWEWGLVIQERVLCKCVGVCNEQSSPESRKAYANIEVRGPPERGYFFPVRVGRRVGQGQDGRRRRRRLAHRKPSYCYRRKNKRKNKIKNTDFLTPVRFV